MIENFISAQKESYGVSLKCPIEALTRLVNGERSLGK